MDKVRLIPVETPSGRGVLFRGEEHLGQVEYSIVVMRRTHESRGETTDGMGRLEGKLRGLDFFNLIGESVTLHLNDGRRWDCTIMDIGGRTVNSGRGLYRPPVS